MPISSTSGSKKSLFPILRSNVPIEIKEQIISKMIEEGCELNEVSNSFLKETPLHVASRQGYAKIVIQLLDAGACIDSMDQDNNTPLHSAIRFTQQNTVEILLNRNSNIRLKNEYGETALLTAIRNLQYFDENASQIFKTILSYYLNTQVFLEQSDPTPLSFALMHNKTSAATTILTQTGNRLSNKSDLLKYITIQCNTTYNDIARFNAEIKPYIENNLLIDEIEALDTHIANLFNTMHLHIKNLLDKNTGKPLLLLLGENHYSIKSALLEAVLIYLAKQHFDMRNFMTETIGHTTSLPDEFLELKEKYIHPLSDKSLYMTISIINLLANRLEITFQSIDMEGLKLAAEDAMTYLPEEIRLRNKGMVFQAMRLAHLGHGILIVGAAHLSDLANDEELNSKYHIHAMNLYDKDVQDPIAEHFGWQLLHLAKHDPKIIQALDEKSTWPHCLTPDLLLERMIYIAEQRMISKKSDDIVYAPPSLIFSDLSSQMHGVKSFKDETPTWMPRIKHST